jgi:hypothetical protein
MSNSRSALYEIVNENGKVRKTLDVWLPSEMVISIMNAITDTLAVAFATLSGEAFIVSKINEKLEDAGLSLRLTNLKKEDVKSDVDRFAADYVNSKIGTNLTGIRSLSKDQILEAVGEQVAQRLNAQAGTTITNIYPVDVLRDQIGAAVVAQLDVNTVGAGSILSMTRKQQVRDAVMGAVELYVPQTSGAPTLGRSAYDMARNRAKQKKYRMTHKAVYVPRLATGTAPPAPTPPAANMVQYNDGRMFGYADGFAAAAQLTGTQLAARSVSWRTGYKTGFSDGSNSRLAAI